MAPVLLKDLIAMNKGMAIHRVEHNTLGSVEVPWDRYYAARTAAAAKFPISGVCINSLLFVLKTLVHVKMAAAQVNCNFMDC